MAGRVPLNFFKRITVPLNRNSDSTPIYTAPTDRASIIINSLVSNTSNSNKLVTLSLSTLNPDILAGTNAVPKYSWTFTKEFYDALIQAPEVSASMTRLLSSGFPITVLPQNNFEIIKNLSIPSLDTQNLTFSKLVLVDGDNLVAKADIEDIRTLEDTNALWEFNVPTSATTVENMLFEFTGTANLTADFGIGNIPNTQANFAVLSSLVPTNYNYNLSNDTGVNLTLSILETNNQP